MMATSRLIIRCKWCNKQLGAPLQAQTITCPVCRGINNLAPPTNGGYYQQPPPPPRYNQRPPTYNHQQTSRPTPMYNAGYNPQPSRPSSYYNQDSMRTPMYDNDYNQRSSRLPSYDRQESMRPMTSNNNNGRYYNQYPMNSSPPIHVTMYDNNHNQRSPRIPSYNRQQSMPPSMNNNYVDDNDGYYTQYDLAPPILNTMKGGYVPVNGRKRAVLCGVSYLNTEHSLDGSISDVQSIRRLLIDKMGFPDPSVIVLTEVERHPMRVPTAKNIMAALQWLVHGSKAGDSLVFYYTGHGSRVPDDGDDEYDGFDEALCPVDYKTGGKIIDDRINDIIVKPLPRGTQLHAIIDTCHSGTALDLCFICRMNSRGKSYWEDHEKPWSTVQATNGGLAVSISACDDHQKCGSTTAFTGKATGALTYSFVRALESGPTLTYGQLMSSMSSEINKVQSGLGLNGSNASAQVPQLSSSEKFDIFSRKFVL